MQGEAERLAEDLQGLEPHIHLLSECDSTEPECNVLSEGKAGEIKNGLQPKIYTPIYRLSFRDLSSFLYS